jgi:hypothetical protein
VAFGVAVASLHLKGGPERNRSGAARRAAPRYLQHVKIYGLRKARVLEE